MGKDLQRWDNETVLKAFREEGNPLLNELYYEFLPLITQYLKKQSSGLRDDEAEDIFADSITVVFKKTLEPDFYFTDSFKSYLFTISKFLLLKVLRKKKNWKKVTEQHLKVQSSVGEFSEEIEKIDEFNYVMKIVEEMDDVCKKMIISFYLEGKGLEDIALDLGYAGANSAKVKKFKCMRKLVDKILEDELTTTNSGNGK